MDSGDWIVLGTSVVAAAVAIIGYALAQFAGRSERRSKEYAEALGAVYNYQELPYRICKRTADQESARDVAMKVSDVFERLSFYQAWMRLESFEVRSAYMDLVAQTQRQGGPYRKQAWERRTATDAPDFYFDGSEFEYDNEPERNLCLLAMQRELLLRKFFLRQSTRRLLLLQRALRAGGK